MLKKAKTQYQPITEVIKILKNSKNKEDCLKKAYQILTKKYKGNRIKTYIDLRDFLKNDINYIWSRSGFLHCNTMNKLLKFLLIKSNHFKPKDIQEKWTLTWYISPHQYLKINTGKRKVNIDIWAKNYGTPYGEYARGFN